MTDASNAAISGAAVEAVNVDTNLRLTATTDGGIYQIQRYSLRFSAEAFNIANHPSFDVPNNSTALYSVSSGKVPVRSPSSSAGYISHTISSPRFPQLNLRLDFQG